MKKYKYLTDYFMYDNDTIEKMYHVRYIGMPVSFLLLDLRKTDTYCHYCSKFLNLVVDDSIRMTGKKNVLNGNSHSWVERGNLVFDSSRMGIWKRNAYYENDGVYDVYETPLDSVIRDISGELDEEGCPELFTAWILDLEEDFDNNPYRGYLRQHISRFKEEKKLNGVELDLELVLACRSELENWHKEVCEFRNKNSCGDSK